MADDEIQPPKTTKVNYTANSNKSKEPSTNRDRETPPEKKVEKVISGDAVQRKKGVGRKIVDTFTGDDMHSVGEFILFDVLLPAVKSMLSDAVSQGVERTLFGTSSNSRRPSSGSSRPGYTSYNKMSSPTGRAGEADGRRELSRRGRANHDFNEIILESRGEAETVLDQLSDLIREYDIATVSNLYDAVGITGSFTDEKWGWTDIRDLREARINRVRGGFLLDLPRPVQLD